MGVGIRHRENHIRIGRGAGKSQGDHFGIGEAVLVDGSRASVDDDVHRFLRIVVVRVMTFVMLFAMHFVSRGGEKNGRLPINADVPENPDIGHGMSGFLRTSV